MSALLWRNTFLKIKVTEYYASALEVLDHHFLDSRSSIARFHVRTFLRKKISIETFMEEIKTVKKLKLKNELTCSKLIVFGHQVLNIKYKIFYFLIKPTLSISNLLF